MSEKMFFVDLEYTKVSVPIRGLFNLTAWIDRMSITGSFFKIVSVPIRGLFNLTIMNTLKLINQTEQNGFRPHQGII